MEYLAEFFKLKSRATWKDIKYIISLSIISIIASFMLPNMLIKYFGESLFFNIFEAIHMRYWILSIIMSIVSIAIIRAILITIITKWSFSKMYYQEIFLHILKYGLLIMPIFMLLILIAGNQVVVDGLNMSDYNNIQNITILGIVLLILFAIIWLYFLGTSVKIFLQRKYSNFMSYSINMIVSFVTTAILGLSILQFNILDVNEHKEALKKTIIKSIEKKYELNDECKSKIMAL